MRFLERLNTPIAVAIVLVLFLVVDGLLLYRHQIKLGEPLATNAPPAATESEATEAPSSVSSTTRGPTTTEQATTSSAEEGGVLRVGVSVVDVPSWLEVQVDGQTALAQVSEPGFSQEFEADREVSIEAGHAGAVQVEVDGRDQGRLGTGDEPTTRTFTR
jgi:hypothetical protein